MTLETVTPLASASSVATADRILLDLANHLEDEAYGICDQILRTENPAEGEQLLRELDETLSTWALALAMLAVKP